MGRSNHPNASGPNRENAASARLAGQAYSGISASLFQLPLPALSRGAMKSHSLRTALAMMRRERMRAGARLR